MSQTRVTTQDIKDAAVTALKLSVLATKGDVMCFSTQHAPLPIGTNGQILIANSGQATGLQWITANADTSLTAGLTGLAVKLDAAGAITTGAVGLKVGVDGTTVTIVGNQLVSHGFTSPLTTKGDVLIFSTANARLPVGTNGQMLLCDSTLATGLRWQGAGDTTLTASTSGWTVNLSAGGCIKDAGAGLQLKFADAAHSANGTLGLAHFYADTSLTTTLSGMRANLATNGGLTVSSGMLVRGRRISAGNPTGLADGDTWYDSTAKGPRMQNDGIVQSTSGIITPNIADSTTVASVAVLTFFDVTQAIPAAYFTAGKTMRIRAIGTYTYTGAPTLSFTLQLTNAGGTVQVSTPAFTPTGATGGRWMMEMVTTCRTVGAPGIFSRMGFQYVETGGLAGTNTLYPSGGTTQTTDTTSALTVKAGCTFSVSSASNSAVLHMLTVEPLN